MNKAFIVVLATVVIKYKIEGIVNEIKYIGSQLFEFVLTPISAKYTYAYLVFGTNSTKVAFIKH